MKWGLICGYILYEQQCSIHGTNMLLGKTDLIILNFPCGSLLFLQGKIVPGVCMGYVYINDNE